MNRSSLGACISAAFAVAAGAALLAPTASTAAPAGNNGTIKIDGVPFDQVPDNQPHVGCLFEVDFYNFDQGQNLYAEVKFAAQPPSGKKYITLLNQTGIFIGEDPNGGGTDVDAERQYDLSTALRQLFEHPNQGYHVKLTVHADGAAGADTKYKTFWVQGCVPTS